MLKDYFGIHCCWFLDKGVNHLFFFSTKTYAESNALVNIDLLMKNTVFFKSFVCLYASIQGSVRIYMYQNFH